jgi:hypothetical protein
MVQYWYVTPCTQRELLAKGVQAWCTGSALYSLAGHRRFSYQQATFRVDLVCIQEGELQHLAPDRSSLAEQSYAPEVYLRSFVPEARLR